MSEQRSCGGKATPLSEKQKREEAEGLADRRGDYDTIAWLLLFFFFYPEFGFKRCWLARPGAQQPWLHPKWWQRWDAQVAAEVATGSRGYLVTQEVTMADPWRCSALLRHWSLLCQQRVS